LTLFGSFEAKAIFRRGVV